MQTGYFVINGKSCFELLTNYIEQNYKVDYVKPLTGGMLYCMEEYSLLVNANLVITIILEKVHNGDDECEVEIIAAGGGTAVFLTTAGKEERWVVRFYNKLVDFCNGNEYEISELEEQ